MGAVLICYLMWEDPAHSGKHPSQGRGSWTVEEWSYGAECKLARIPSLLLSVGTASYFTFLPPGCLPP